MSLNDQLKELYQEHWNKYYAEYDSKKNVQKLVLPAMPLLLGIGDENEYLNSDFKIMLFGQETNGWGEFRENININELQKWNYGKTSIQRGKGQFANGRVGLMRNFKKYFPDMKSSLVWNNVVKIGKSKDKGFPGHNLYQIENSQFNVLKEEINILKPNIIIFFSGYRYDQYIFDKFGKLESIQISGFQKHQLCEFKIPNIQCALRTYHPNYLFRNGIDKYYNAIINSVNLRIK